MRSKFSRIGLVSTAIAVTALTALPATGWLVRQQLQVIAGGSLAGLEKPATRDWATIKDREAAVVAAHPDDFRFQFAGAIRANEMAADGRRADSEPDVLQDKNQDRLKSPRLLAILPLDDRFGNQAEYQADVLRYLCLGDLRLNRNEENILLSPKYYQESLENERKAAEEGKTPKTSTAAIALALHSATRGEALDPDNAFFPTMLAITLLADHKDADAIETLKRAADKPAWNDYSADEARDRTALMVAASGSEPGAFARTTATAVVLLPQFSQIRDMARVMTALAVDREIAGDKEGGFEVRRAMARVGAKMRAQPRSLIASLVGSAITSITAARPGGASHIESASLANDDRSAASEARYISYLTENGHSDEAAWFVGERAAARKMAEITKISESSDDMRPYAWLAGWWTGSFLLLASVFAMVAFGGASAFLARSKRIAGGLPLDAGVRWGLFLSLQIPICLVANSVLAVDCGLTAIAMPIAVIDAMLVGLALVCMKRKQSWTDLGRSAAVAVATIAGAGLLFAGAMWLGKCAASPFGFITTIWGAGPENGDVAVRMPGQALLAGLTLLVPFVLLIAFAIRSRIARIPVSVGVLRGFRASAIPAAAVLSALYVAAAIGTVAQDNNVRAEIEHQMTDEGSYQAAKLGTEWPGPTAMISNNSEMRKRESLPASPPLHDLVKRRGGWEGHVSP